MKAIITLQGYLQLLYAVIASSLTKNQSKTINAGLTKEILAAKLKKKEGIWLPKTTGESVLTGICEEDD